ncbi:MAG: 16S rRNA (cytidine(1402)-2'-O)-methyltransferase [Leptolyngbyaceae cyanobacterium]
MAFSPLPSALYIVGTPIGNLGDITFRAIETLKAVDLIAAEDTRRTGRLLQHFESATPQTSYHAHNWRKRLPTLLAHLETGQSLALVSDAGMPGISDPGFELVEACADQFIVVPIPGVTAAVTALCASGLAPQPFTFEGFLPPKGRLRKTLLEALAQEHRTMVLYESPHRLLKTLEDLAIALEPERRVAIARELTKQYEEIWRGSLAEAMAHYQDKAPRGEFTLVIAGSISVQEESPPSEIDLKQRLQELLESGLSRSQASRQLAQETRQPRRDLYQLALTLPELTLPKDKP